MIAEAIDTVITLGWALLAWIVLCALFATAALYTLTVTAAWIVAGLWRAGRAVAALRTHQAPAGAPNSPSAVSRDAEDATEPANRHLRPRPTWSQP